MKEQVRVMFSEITMPEETEQKVLAAVSRRRKKPQTPFVRSIATLAAVLALVILVSPTARAALENWVVKYFFPGSDLTIYEQTDESGNVTGIVGVVDTEAPPFARMVNGRLYFLGNGEKIDITDILTEETPYFYTYLDDYGLTHYMAVGYSGELTNYGIYEFIKEETPGQETWVTGTGRNFLDPETESRYPWVDIVWEELAIPWPKPGD